MYGLKTNLMKGKSKMTDHMELLRARPKLLYSRDHKLVVLFSPKSACTFVTKWFFFQLGLLDEALQYHEWIHEYRIHRFYKNAWYERFLHAILEQDYKTVKITRNPFSRAVSSYIVYLQQPGHAECTFEDFIEWLRTIDIENYFDTHFTIQSHKLEIHDVLKPDYCFDMLESMEKLREVENELGLVNANFHELRKSRHNTVREQETGYCGNKLMNKRSSFPEYHHFYNDEMEQAVLDIYRIDFEMYGYPKKLQPEGGEKP
ncbi:MAG: hypothetical protein DRI61_12970 [Chloroflexi bacterium]|nr:MAG: hypothetical protein DRI61_12970 [Chloroflexota bacterium]